MHKTRGRWQWPYLRCLVKLSVNINKIATLRNARGGRVPDVVGAAVRIEQFGAHGITVHPRPDERHIRYEDVRALSKVIRTEFNIEGYPDRKWLDLALSVKPTQATLVPDPPGALTSSAGWDTGRHRAFLTEVITELRTAGIRTSVFTDTQAGTLEGAAACGAHRVELYTEPYASAYRGGREAAVASFVRASETAHSLGLGVNAGHDLNLENLRFFTVSLPYLDEVSIGHALISDSLYFGLENTVQMYLAKLV